MNGEYSFHFEKLLISFEFDYHRVTQSLTGKVFSLHHPIILSKD
ncbi:hypothetical protein M124_2472 [Bacteroides fragilis str. 3988T(B)14]|uniref:Uncharacterized protein n=1 Tax=Bacteroides fragilis str. 3988T(B)14 TaxID=1339315 RepID=A0A015UIN2_BACFG|nr:hypothetical protein M124_2472 [Bacteroides fragilis str. 3988T(B)14]EXY79701.1 hypothetical protein M084_2539 [Bacteroides fragilis str. 3988 T1]EYA60937.1 hypothetical protein M070_2845 [Bacteroides fragilis str. A7 (UDC12-2)]